MIFYRFYKNKKYRDEFINGEFRFGNLSSYKKINDNTRRDKNEGKTIWKYKFRSCNVYSTGQGLGIFFILSICDESVNMEKMLKKGYKYAVRIQDLQKLHALLNEYYVFDWKIGDIRRVKVNYDRGDDPRGSKDQSLIYSNIHYFQKSQKDAYCHEWRFVMKSEPGTNDNKEFIKINIGNISDYVSPINF